MTDFERRMKLEVNVYRIEPIDDWNGWTPLSQYLRGVEDAGVPNLIAFIGRACTVAAKHGWEGDMTEVRVIRVPGRNDVIVAWKQDNDGSTFIAAAGTLDHLEKTDWCTWNCRKICRGSGDKAA